MRLIVLSGVAALSSIVGALAAPAARAQAPAEPVARNADLVWEVVSPFRLYKHARSFKLHEDAYRLVRGSGETVPADIVERVERCLNDPAPRSPCAVLGRGVPEEAKRRGWASRTLDDVCYERGAAPRHYPVRCARERRTGMALEDYVLPTSHTVSIGLSPAMLAQAGSGACTWNWHSRAGGVVKSITAPCAQRLTIEAVPFSPERARSGVAVAVTLPDGSTKGDPDVVVDDMLMVALGDSFASGEGNPDRPVTFSPNIALDYRAPMEDFQTSMRGAEQRPVPPPVTGPGGVAPDPYVLPRRLVAGDSADIRLAVRSAAFDKAFWEASAGWLSPDCHRSQYAYPIRVGLQLALEDRHRAVTIVHLACSGAETTKGVLGPMEPREDKAKTKAVESQIAQLTALLCRADARKFNRSPAFTLPVVTRMAGEPERAVLSPPLCGKAALKRPIDVVLLSIGGNDSGFGPLAAYVMLDRLADIGWLVEAFGGNLRYGPALAERQLEVLDERIQALKLTLQEGFGITPAQVIHTSYERVQNDERGQLCGDNPRLGMDVHDKLKLDRGRMAESSKFVDRMFDRLQCLSAWQPGCPAGLKTGRGTGFTLVTSHQPAFNRRGICARGPGDGDGALMQIPRFIEGEFKPYNPADFRPYKSRARLFHTPNDAFMTANTHREETIILDPLQPAFAALYSGAMHPTAEAHAIVADNVLPYARAVLEKRGK